MEDLNQNAVTSTTEENVTKDETLQPVAQQEAPAAAANDSDINNTTAPEPATSEQPAENEQPAAATTPNNEAEPEPVVDYSSLGREDLLAAFNELMGDDISRIRNRASAIRNQFNLLNKEVEKQAFEAFLAEGGNKEDYKPAADAVAEAFYKAYDTYRARRQKMQEEIDAQKAANLEAKKQILEELRTLINKDEETLKQTYDEFNAIQDKWKAIGEVPRDQMNDLWQNYHFLIEQFFNKVKINKELRMLDLKRNLEQKIQLCERAEELIVETSVVKAFKALQELRAQWREIGPVPTEQNEETWQRFNNAANQIDERRREYYNDTTAALDELLKLWKSIGPVPREQNEEVWNKFKGIIDKHYADKKLHFGQMRDEQSENYNKKVDLCLRAEAIAKREDWKKATEELLQLQAEWKTIGPTSRKVSDKIWHRFRSACDEFFAKKGEFFKDIRSSESENLTKKTAILEEIKAYQFGDNKEENLTAIKDFQRRWAEIGHVPMKEKDRIQKEYRSLLDGIFEQLKISAREADENNYRERIRNHSGAGNERFRDNERNQLLNQIEKMRSDLKLWENNLGFLANSKQADLLKEEFERKMDNTRRQIALLEAKVRILDEASEEKEQNNETKE